MGSLSDLVERVRSEAAQTHDRITQRAGQDVTRLLQDAGVVFQQRMLQIANACDTLVAVVDQRFLLPSKEGPASSGGASAAPSAAPSAVPSRAHTPPAPVKAEVLVKAEDKGTTEAAPSVDAARPAAARAPDMAQMLGMLAKPEVVAALRVAEASGMRPDALMALLQHASTSGKRGG